MTTNYVRLARDELRELRAKSAKSAKSAQSSAIDPPAPVCGCFPGRELPSAEDETREDFVQAEETAELASRY
jgi:hypothetical protein